VLNKNAERFGQEKVFLGDLPTFASMTNDPSIMEILIRIEALERRLFESISSFLRVARLLFLAWKNDETCVSGIAVGFKGKYRDR
jgi:hypothetical protein